MIKLFLSCSRVDLNLQNHKGETALHIAAKHGNAETVSALLHRQEVDPDITTKNGRTAYKIAQDNQNQEIVKLFDTYFRVRSEKGCSVA